MVSGDAGVSLQSRQQTLAGKIQALRFSELDEGEGENIAGHTLRQAWKVHMGDLGDAGIAARGLAVGHEHDGLAIRRYLHGAERYSFRQAFYKRPIRAGNTQR